MGFRFGKYRSRKPQNPLHGSIALAIFALVMLGSGAFLWKKSASQEAVVARSELVSAQVVSSRTQKRGSGKNRSTDYYLTVELMQDGQPGPSREFEVASSVYRKFDHATALAPIPVKAFVDRGNPAAWELEDDLRDEISSNKLWGTGLPLGGLGVLAGAYFMFRTWLHKRRNPGHPSGVTFYGHQVGQAHVPDMPPAQGYPPQPQRGGYPPQPAQQVVNPPMPGQRRQPDPSNVLYDASRDQPRA